MIIILCNYKSKLRQKLTFYIEMTIIFSFFFVLKKYSQLRMYILFHMALRVLFGKIIISCVTYSQDQNMCRRHFNWFRRFNDTAIFKQFFTPSHPPPPPLFFRKTSILNLLIEKKIILYELVLTFFFFESVGNYTKNLSITIR